MFEIRKRMVRHSVWVLLLSAVASTAWGQATVRGTVTDPLGAVIKDAKVTLQRGDAGAGDTMTNAEGMFSFSSVNSGRYRVQVDASGFKQYTGPEVFVGSSGNATLDVSMQISELSQNIVVSATGSEIPISQVGASVGIIDNTDIQAQNKLDVLENLRQVSGVQIVQSSQRGGNTSLFIRGGESSFNKVMIDGAPANAIGGGFDFAQLSSSGVESVEVLKGANSVLYGADGLAGVVNLTTRRGTSSIPEFKYSVDGGNFGTVYQAPSLAGAFRQFDYFSTFTRFDTKGSYSNNYFHNATYAGNFGWTPMAGTDLRVTYRRNWTEAGLPNGLLLYGIGDDSRQKNQNQYLAGTVQNQTTERWHNLGRFAYSQFVSDYTNPTPTGKPDSFGFGNYVGNNMTIVGANGYSVTGQAILDYAGKYPSRFPSYEARRSAYGQSDYRFFRDWTGTFGIRYEHENGSGFTRDNYSYIMEAHGSFSRRLYVTAGVGVENNAVFGVEATPRVSFAYYLRQPTASSFFAETKLRFNYGEGIKETSTFQEGSQLFAVLTPTQRTQFSVSPLGPERSRALDAGVEQGLWNGRARLGVTYFHNRFYDLISYLSTTALVSIGVPPAAAQATGFGAYVNATSTKANGMEIEFVSQLTRSLRVQGNYTYLDAEVTKAFGSPSTNSKFPGIPIGAYSPLQGQRPFRRAPHSGSLGVIYSAKRFTGSFTGYMVSRRDDSTFLSDAGFGNSLLLPNRDLAPAYQKFDLSGRYTVNRVLALYTSMENVFSQHYQAVFGFPAAPFTFRGGITITIGGDEWKK